MKPHVWIHKETGELVIVAPWLWSDESLEWEPEIPVQIALTAVFQVGWLYCNKNDVYFGLNMGSANEFDDLGAL